jgi:hypothetical protein
VLLRDRLGLVEGPESFAPARRLNGREPFVRTR